MKKGRGDQDMNKKAWKAGAVSALAVGAGLAAAASKRKKAGKVVKSASDYRNTERGSQEKNSKGIYYSKGNYEAFARPEKPAAKLGKKLLLPVDAAVAASFPDPIDAPIEVQNVSVDAIPADTMGLDIGPETAKLYADTVKSAKTVVWNGPMGVFENPTLAQGTIAVAKALADTEATTIIGGGDSAAAVNQLGFGDKMTHISTGGGASLEFLEGKELPGVAAANDK